MNNLTLPTPPAEKQILLRVKFAELDRSKEVQFGVNLLAAPGGNAIGAGTGQFGNGSFTGTVAIPPTRQAHYDVHRRRLPDHAIRQQRHLHHHASA